MIEEFAPGSDLTIMNTYYQRAVRNDYGEKVLDDLICLVYKNNETGKKYHEIIKKPNITFYVANDNVQIDHNLLFIEKDKVHPVTVPYDKLNLKLAELEGLQEEFKEWRRERDWASIRSLQENPRIFSSDMSIEDYYRAIFARKFKNNIEKVSKSFFDIEVDGKDAEGDFVRNGECPINAIAFMDEKNRIHRQYLLRNPENPLIHQYEEEIKSGRFTEDDIKDFIKQAVGGWKQFKRYHLDEFHYEIIFFDDELELLSTFFNDVHTYNPDFCEGWNSCAFDLEYIIARIQVLGEEPANIMCDNSWEVGIVNNYVDTRNLSDLAERNDFTFISGDTTWIDGLVQYASRRKAKIGSYKSFKLDDIGELVAGVHKLDYSDITNSVVMLPWLDYKRFSLYNIVDPIVNHCIEQKCNDIEYIFSKAIMNDTGYRKVHRQTTYLINRMRKEWYDKKNLIMGNNVNKSNKKDSKFEGALVMDPNKLGDRNKMKMPDGVPINVIENCIDFDYKALYPSSIEEQNIAPNTQVGRLDIANKWKAIYHYNNNGTKKDIELWIFDPGNAHDFPFLEVDVKEGKNRKKKIIYPTVYLYLDENLTKPIDVTGDGTNALVYHQENFTTLYYNRVYENENSYLNELYTRSGEFLENMVTDNVIEFAHRWFNLGNIQDLLDDINEYYQANCKSYSSYGYWQEYNIREHQLVVTPMIDLQDDKLKPIFFIDNDHIHPVSFYMERNKDDRE